MLAILLGAALVLAALGWSAYAWCVFEGARAGRRRQEADGQRATRHERAIRMTPPVRARTFDPVSGTLEEKPDPPGHLASPAWVMEKTMDERFDATLPDNGARGESASGSDWL